MLDNQTSFSNHHNPSLALWDLHTHNVLCKHAQGELEEYVKSAINKGLRAIGLSDHFPMYLLPKSANVWQYSMSKNEFPKYIERIKQLRAKYKGEIEVLIASEVDFYPQQFDAYKKAIDPFWDDLDYIIGSVHVIQWDDINAWAIDDDNSPEFFKKYGVDLVYQKYYQRIEEMVKKNYFNIVGHLDLPKKYGLRPNDKEKIKNQILSLLDEISKHDIAVEINVSGLYKPVHEQYPEDWIIKELIDRKIPITLGSDSHLPERVAYKFNTILSKIKKWGLNELNIFHNHKREKIKI